MAGVEVTWLVLIPCILGCAVVLTDWAWRAMQGSVAPRRCLHTHYIFGRCVECGTPV